MVVVSADRTTKPLIALTSPDKPTVVLSQPDRTADAASAKAAANAPKGANPASAGAAGRTADAVKDRAGKTLEGKSESAKLGAGNSEAAKPEGLDARKPDTVPVKVVSVDAEEGGRLFVTGQAPAGATVRLYINDTLIAPGSVGTDGRVSFTIGRGVAPGDYRIRIDQVDPVSGKVKNRSEVGFAMPVAAKPALGIGQEAPSGGVATLSTPALSAKPSPSAALAGRVHAKSPVAQTYGSHPAASGRPVQGAPQDASPSAPASPMTVGRSQPGPTTGEAEVATAQVPAAQVQAEAPTESVFVPEINTARITRGDSLWQISRRVYGKGTRYTVIFDANQPQIRNPDLIYPGQIFVVPSESASTLPEDKRRS